MNPLAIAGVSRVIVHAPGGVASVSRALARDGASVSRVSLAAKNAVTEADDSARVLAAMSETSSYGKGISFEYRTERWLHSHGVAVSRNTKVDLELPDGSVVRPDLLEAGAFQGALYIGEIKNRALMPLTNQLRQYLGVARANGVPLNLFMPKGSAVTRPLQSLIDAGDVRRITIAAGR